jgi:hypothetical protein
MVYRHDLFQRPMEIIGYKGYLSVNLIDWVALYYSPAGLTSTVNLWSHFGHVASNVGDPVSLMRW